MPLVFLAGCLLATLAGAIVAFAYFLAFLVNWAVVLFSAALLRAESAYLTHFYITIPYNQGDYRLFVYGRWVNQ